MVSTTGSVLICNIQEVGYESIPDKLWYVNEAFYWCYVYCCVLRFPSYPVHAKYMPTATSLTVFSDHIRFSMHGLNRQIMLQALHDMLQVIHNMLQIINNTSTLRYYKHYKHILIFLKNKFRGCDFCFIKIKSTWYCNPISYLEIYFFMG